MEKVTETDVDERIEHAVDEMYRYLRLGEFKYKEVKKILSLIGKKALMDARF